MFESSGGPAGRSSTPSSDRNVRIPRDLYNQFGSFRDLVSFTYPGPKPQVALAQLTKKSERHCLRWLNSEVEPPASVLALVMSEFLWSLGHRLQH